MNLCGRCGAPVSRRIPPGDDRPRHVCDACAAIHYQNPKIVAGCVPEHAGRVLMCRRAIEPRHGYWTLPAGFMENGETTAAAAAREAHEEALARVEIGAMFCYLDLPRINQVHIFFLARLLNADWGAGAESLEVRLFEEEEIPWAELAFPSIEIALDRWMADRRRGTFGLHVEDIHRRPGERATGR
jgi:ADP-ribose pyrophosphatase YjhB (NUDIX family)